MNEKYDEAHIIIGDEEHHLAQLFLIGFKLDKKL